ncbi:formylglycine-generating enzyme family protein [Sedimenticola thiotaurini]|uniref:formylglycine-generating enzyme family protein n=1 Tax=Sedimenticola thiotaurini TaxID=1543721 RepID=UPI001900F3BC|nr:formylglycine-generating enzyme family protein [Sedimenticola thiotaurini]
MPPDKLCRWYLHLTLIATIVVHPVLADGYDVVTLNNGDIYNGTVAQPYFTLVTRYGEVTIPYAQMALLRRGGADQSDLIQTHRGDRFSGRLKERRVTVLRVLDPLLPVATEDISDILFAHRQFRPRPFRSPDSVITRSGDRFAARLLTGLLPLIGQDGPRLTNPDEIQRLDVATDDEGDDYLAQIVTNTGEVLQGKFNLESVVVETAVGVTLTIPITELSQLALRVNRPGHPPLFRSLQRLNPANLIQDRMRDGTPGPQMRVLRGGRYTQGDLQGDGDGDERPTRLVSLQPFAIGVYEVTFEEYDRFCRDTGHRRPDDQGWGRGDRPVVNVTWVDANRFADWLSRRTGQRYRLPTDAEWEYAARGGTSSRYWWGDDVVPGQANCADCGSLWDGEKSAPVGRFLPNPFGLHDTAGNVFEWVQECWRDDFSIPPGQDAGVGDGKCGKRVIRGGAWSFPHQEVRPANRWRDFPTRRSDDTGFRLVRELRAD